MAMPAQPHTPPAPSPATIACPHCGGQCTASARFCGHCRQAIQQQAAAPVATGGAAQPNPQPQGQQGGGLAPTQAGAPPQQGFQPFGQQPQATPAPTNWVGVVKTGVLVCGGLLALFIVGNVLEPFFNPRQPAAPDDWSDAGVAEAGTGSSDGGTNPRNSSDGGVPLVQGPLVVNNNTTNNGVPVAQQPTGCCIETVDIDRRIHMFRGPKAWAERERYLRTHPFPSN